MTATQQADIDPNEAMAGLEEGYVEEAGGGDGGASASAATAATTTATTSSTEETPEALAARVAAEGEEARTINPQQNSQTNTAGAAATNNAATTGSLLEQSATRTEGKVITLADSDLVMVDGNLVPFGQVKASTVFKPKYDQAIRERDALATERDSVLKRDEKLKGVEPYVKVLEEDPYLRIYTNTKLLGRTEDEAHAAAAAATGRTAPASTATARTIDPRLVPPVDEQGDPLPKDHPDYLEWLAGPKTEATAEAATKRVLAEAQAETDRKAKAERDAAAERERTTSRAAAEAQVIENENRRVLGQLHVELTKRGIDVAGMTPAQWTQAVGVFADASASYEKDIRDAQWLREHVLTVGDIRSVLDTVGFLDKLKPASDRGPGTAPEIGANGAAATNGAANSTEGATRTGKPAMQNNYAKRPLAAFSPSEAIPGSSAEIASVASDEEKTIEAMNSLG